VRGVPSFRALALQLFLPLALLVDGGSLHTGLPLETMSKDMPQAAGQKGDLNPKTAQEAEKLLRYVESLCNPWDVDAMANGFTEDCVARFGLLPEMRGREAVREFFRKRSLRQRNYVLRKDLRFMAEGALAIDWNATWEDAGTGKRMRGHGVELWQLRDGKIAVWEAAFNIASSDEESDLAIV
jgi:nuclear transport factor 2 (NTF2) superfamily protein